MATGEGLCVDPSKVRAIIEMPPPKDVTVMQHLLGLAQFLGKFLSHLLEITKCLREITQTGSGTIPRKCVRHAKESHHEHTHTLLLQLEGRG